MQMHNMKAGYKIFWDGLSLMVGIPVVFLLTLLTTFSFRKAKESVTGEEGKAAARDWGDSIVTAFFIAMVIRTFLFQPFRIPSGSMRPTLIEEDRLFVNKLAYGPLLPFTKIRIPGFTKPRRGDVVVFRFPVTRDKDFIKRVIAFGGEKIEIREGQVLVDGQPVIDGTIAKIHYYNMGEYAVVGHSIDVPPGHFFVMGDNSRGSHDSRFWGFVPQELLIGRADVIFWPPTRMRLIK